jgi:hypothetical protein
VLDKIPNFDRLFRSTRSTNKSNLSKKTKDTCFYLHKEQNNKMYCRLVRFGFQFFFPLPRSKCLRLISFSDLVMNSWFRQSQRVGCVRAIDKSPSPTGSRPDSNIRTDYTTVWLILNLLHTYFSFSHGEDLEFTAYKFQGSPWTEQNSTCTARSGNQRHARVERSQKRALATWCTPILLFNPGFG